MVQRLMVNAMNKSIEKKLKAIKKQAAYSASF